MDGGAVGSTANPSETGVEAEVPLDDCLSPASDLNRTPSLSRGSSSSRSDAGEDDRPENDGPPPDFGIEHMRLSGDDVAQLSFGRFPEKISRVSDCHCVLREKDLQLELRGTLSQRRRARKYAGIVTKQRAGPGGIDYGYDDGDLTIISIPPDVVGFVQGQGASVLRSIEEEWGTLMVFIDNDLSRAQRLAVFGSVRGRRGSELKVLSAVETKMQGYFAGVRDEVISRDKYRDETGTWGTDTMVFREGSRGEEGEISYALGKQGGTRKKLERSSGSIIQYVGMEAICSGTRIQRTRAREYMKWLFQQLEGPVYVRGWEAREDCTVVDVPQDCIGYVTGNRRAALGSIEEEWGTLMFFMNESEDKGRGRGGTEKLAIFGPPRPRRGSELKVMSSIETKSPGFFTRGIKEKISTKPGFDTDRFLFRDEEVSYALGKDGGTRKKLEQASGAILQYVGFVAFIAGTMKERARCREFIVWLLQQRRGSVTITQAEKRDDCTVVHIPVSCKGWVTGNRGSELRRMEQESGTYMFMALDEKGEERLLIFGANSGDTPGSTGGRKYAERLVEDMVQEKFRGDERDGRRRGRSDSRSGDRKKRKWNSSSSGSPQRSKASKNRTRGWD